MRFLEVKKRRKTKREPEDRWAMPLNNNNDRSPGSVSYESFNYSQKELILGRNELLGKSN